jgi:nitroreductase
MNKRIRSIIPISLWVKIKRWLIKIKLIILYFFSSTGLLSSIFFMIFSRDFAREQRAVLFGHYQYLRLLVGNQPARYLIRRNIHRLEKGLLMRPRRDLFGVEYIMDTVQAYKNAIVYEKKSNEPLPELGWARDVLLQYFSVVRAHKIVDQAREIFSRIELDRSDPHELTRVPYKRNIEQASLVDYESLVELAMRRRSVRWYLQKPVPRELIDKAIEVALLSPSSCNRQPFEFRVYDDPDLVKVMASLPWGTSGYHENIPVIVVLIGEQKAFIDTRDRHLIYIDSSLAAMAFMFALETLGLSSCAINWPDMTERERKMAEFISLKPDERPIMLIALGYPDPEGLIGYSQKKSLEEIRSYNKR